MNQWKAASIHLIISFVVACVTALFIRFVLYPDFYFYLSGGFRLLFLIIGVDVVIGPLLTLIIYRAYKKGLMFDLCVIAALQIAALVYGVHTMWVARPVYNVFAVDRFVVVASVDIKNENLRKAAAEYRRKPWFGPDLVAADLPVDPDAQMDLVFSAISGADIETYPQYYVSFASKKVQVAEKSKPLLDLRDKTPEASKLIDEFLNKYKGEEEGYRYLPVKGFSPDFMAMVLRADGTPMAALAIDPW